MRIVYAFHPLPFGECLQAVAGGKICRVSMTTPATRREALAELKSRWPDADIIESRDATRRHTGCIEAFVKKHVVSERDLLLEGTPFQVKVWRALLAIPFGTLVSYQDVARSIGMPSAVRAVANAVGANPIAILIPCHRVIRSDASIGGYRWGIGVKKKIIEWEADQPVSKRRSSPR